MTTRKYTSRSQQTTLTSAVTSGATILPVASATTLLGGASVSTGQTFTVVIDPDTSLEEIVDVTIVSGNNLTVTRAVDMSGAAAQDHSAGAVVRHMIIGRDLREANTHIEASTAYNDGTGTHSLHGLGASDGSVVGTDATQTLTNKTLVSPILTGTLENDSGITFEGSTADSYETFLTVVDPTQDNTITLPNTSGTVGIIDAVQTLTNKTITSPTINGTPVITGLSSAGMVSTSATPKSYVDSILGSATAASTSATSAATSASSAATSASSAATSASSALTSQTAAATSATSAAASATAAATSAASVATSAASAATSATSAATSATSAAASATAAASSATTASNSAAAAATSATSAAASATAAATSATSAAASATAAATSAASALTSQTAAATSAANAATSATSAATSATSAANAITTITGMTGSGLVRDMGSIADTDTTTATYISIATVADAAATSAASASTSATSAATSASSAATSASSAATSATSAANSAAAAATSATSAAASATAAASSAADAAASAATAIPKSTVTTKGDLIVGTGASTVTRLGAGTNGYILSADNTTTSGLSWIAANPGDITSVSVSSPITGGGTAGDVTISIQDASTSQKGAVQLTDSTASTSITTAATPNSVKTAYDTAAAKVASVTSANTGRISVGGTSTAPTIDLVATAVTSGSYTNASITVDSYGRLTAASNGTAPVTSVTAANTSITVGGTSTAPTVALNTSSVYVLPSQSGSNGYFLTTNGSTASWANLSDWGSI